MHPVSDPLYRKTGAVPGKRMLSLLQKRTCYQAKPFLTDRERRFYRDLSQGLSGTSLQVMAQVRLADVVQTAPDSVVPMPCLFFAGYPGGTVTLSSSMSARLP